MAALFCTRVAWRCVAMGRSWGQQSRLIARGAGIVTVYGKYGACDVMVDPCASTNGKARLPGWGWLAEYGGVQRIRGCDLRLLGSPPCDRLGKHTLYHLPDVSTNLQCKAGIRDWSSLQCAAHHAWNGRERRIDVGWNINGTQARARPISLNLALIRAFVMVRSQVPNLANED
eukprot:9374272-Pyramimonas_sp.AAC.1